MHVWYQEVKQRQQLVGYLAHSTIAGAVLTLEMMPAGQLSPMHQLRGGFYSSPELVAAPLMIISIIAAAASMAPPPPVRISLRDPSIPGTCGHHDGFGSLPEAN